MPKPESLLLSEIKNITIPKGLYHAKVLKDAECKSDDNESYIKMWLLLTNKNKVQFQKSITLSHNDKGFMKVYRYCVATGRDYRLGQLKDLKGDEFYIEFDVYKSEWTDKNGQHRVSDRNAVRDFFTKGEAIILYRQQQETEEVLNSISKKVNHDNLKLHTASSTLSDSSLVKSTFAADNGFTDDDIPF